MSASRQRQLVLIASLGLTMLLLGAVLGGAVIWRSTRGQMQDPQFLQRQLERVGLEGKQPGDGSSPDADAALVRVGVAERKTIRPQKPIIGRLVELRKVTVASEVLGKIVEIPVEEGTPVVANQTVLARVDDVWSRLALDRCGAQVASTEAKLDYEQLELERHEELDGRGAVSRSELESKRALVDELKANRDEALAAVKEAGERKTRCVILAPFDGTVIAKHAELGGHVSPGTPIVEIVSRGQVDARVMVPESLINLIGVDQTLPIRVDPLGEAFRGKVVSLTPYGPSASRTFPVRVRLDDQQGRLKVGMSVTAMIATGPELEALVVSKDAVLVRPDGSTVWVAVARGAPESAEVQPVPVSIRVRMPQHYAIEPQTRQGRTLLTSGSQVVVEGAERLMPGQQVRVVTLDGGPADVAGSLPHDHAAQPAAAGGGPAASQES
jgi:RND family efflux transporter MFP subunit